MLESQKQQIARAIDAYLDEHQPNGMSQGKLATLCGVNPSYISHIRNCNWNSVPVGGGKTTSIGDQVWRKIQMALGLTSEAFETGVYVDIMTALIEAKKQAGYRIIDGATGQGKTFAISEFQRQFPTGTYVLKCANAMTANEFVRGIAEAVGVPKTGSKMAVIEAIGEKLGREAHGLLVIDEAETVLKKKLAIGFLKDLYDKVEGRAGIVITGANDFLNQLKDRASRNTESFPQVLRRFGANPVLLSDGIDADDAVVICESYGITAKREVNSLLASCANYGTLFSVLNKRKTDAELLAA